NLDAAALGHLDLDGRCSVFVGKPANAARKHEIAVLDFVPIDIARTLAFDLVAEFVVGLFGFVGHRPIRLRHGWPRNVLMVRSSQSSGGIGLRCGGGTPSLRNASSAIATCRFCRRLRGL